MFSLINIKKGETCLSLTDEGVAMIESLCEVMCTEDEIAKILKTDLSVLNNNFNFDRFEEAKSVGYAKAKASLRRSQWERAKNGNPIMLIWLGKQWLGQKDSNVDSDKEQIKKLDEIIEGFKHATVKETD